MATAASKTKAAGGADKGLKVTSRPATFRRAGFNFSSEARVIPLSELTEEQVEMITNETSLVSQVVDIPPEPKVDKK
jgi:hypothetical protein